MRTDPTDTGGLFLGRRPGTAPVRYRALPPRGTRRRQVIDQCVAAFLLVVMVLVCVAFWGPLPAGWLWVGSQVDYHSGSVMFGIVVAFVGLLFTYLLGLVILRQLDHLWILVRRAAGYDQRTGTIGPIFAVGAVIGVICFSVWFFILTGPGSGLFPGQPA